MIPNASTADAANLDATARPLGYTVQPATPDHILTPISEPGTTFFVRRIGQPDAAGRAFPDADSVRSYLDELTAAPLWQLDFDESIEVDGTTITHTTTGESLDLAGTKYGHLGTSTTPEGTAAFSVTVRGDTAPSVGRWYKVPPRDTAA